MKKILAILFCVAILGGAFALPVLASPYTAEHDPPLLNRPDRPLRDEDILIAYLALLLVAVPSVSFFLYCLITAKIEKERAQKEKEEQLRKKQSSSTPSPSKQDTPTPPKPVIVLQPQQKKADPPPEPMPISLPTPPPQEPDEIPTQHYLPRKKVRELMKPRSALNYVDKITIDHFDILSIDPDFLTEKQAWDYVASIETPRGKRAVSEPLWIKNAKTDKAVTPYRASATFISTNSLQEYTTTLEKCTCPDYIKRELPCKHMIALAIKVKAIEVDVAHLLNRDDYV